MKLQKQLTAALMSVAFFGATANAEIVLTDDLSLSGYVDIWLDSLDGESDADLGVQELELAFSFTPADSPWSAVAEISFDGDDVFDGDEGITSDFETVTITYAASDALSYSIGNILSYQGFETFDATGLYQYSYSGQGGAALYSAAYAFGACADYVTADYSLGFWVGDNGGDASTEYLFAYTGIEDLTLKFIYADDPGYESKNIWGSYDYADFTFAFEYYDSEQTTGAETDTMMFLVYKAFGDAGLTVRYVDGTDQGVDYDRLTFSPSYAFSDNVFGLLEFSFDETDAGATSEEFAAELIYSF